MCAPGLREEQALKDREGKVEKRIIK